ncbi:MAG: hypothetical protein JXR37_15860 [Kiritimatiellae bacterium]|nr:hypothetical protein [Kiritimatiellia bacterium]
MLKTYEATYCHGRLKWLHGRPSIPDGGRVLVVVETTGSTTAPTPAHSRPNWDLVRERLDKAYDTAYSSGTSTTGDENG